MAFQRAPGDCRFVYYHEKSVEEVAEIGGDPGSDSKTRMFYCA